MNRYSHQLRKAILLSATAGVKRQPISPALIDSARDSETGKILCACLAGGENSLGVLRASAAAFAFEQAGWVPGFELSGKKNTLATSEKPLFESDLDYERDPQKVLLLKNIFNGASQEAKFLVMKLIYKQEKRIPPSCVASALNAAKGSTELRPYLMSVIGKWGGAVASRNPNWKYAVDLAKEKSVDVSSVWETGSPMDRIKFLTSEIHADRAFARQRFMGSLKEMSVSEKSNLLSLFRAGLCMDDEPMLVQIGKERSGDLKLASQKFLACLDDSESSVAIKKALRGLLRKEGQSWVIDAPEAFDENWAGYGISQKSGSSFKPLGERAWWLSELIRLTPLSFWTDECHMTAKEAMDFAEKSVWKDSFINAWIFAIEGALNMQWAIEFDRKKNEFKLNNYSSADKIQSQLGSSDQEKIWIQSIQNYSKSVFLTLEKIVECKRGDKMNELGPDVSKALIDTFIKMCGDPSLKFANSYRISYLFSHLALVIHSDYLAQYELLFDHFWQAKKFNEVNSNFLELLGSIEKRDIKLNLEIRNLFV